DDTPRLVSQLLYGSGLRLLESLRLRVKDIDFEFHSVTIRDGKGHKDRCVGLPRTVESPLRTHLAVVRARHERELATGRGSALLPDALGIKYPGFSRQWGWQWVFPAPKPSRDPRTGFVSIHHIQPITLQRAVARAVKAA